MEPNTNIHEGKVKACFSNVFLIVIMCWSFFLIVYYVLGFKITLNNFSVMSQSLHAVILLLCVSGQASQDYLLTLDTFLERKIVNIFLPIRFIICYGC